ncbi:MAG: WD40 repeat protein, partial [Paraglaciecola sp.]
MTKKINIKKIAQLTGHNASIFALAAGKDAEHFRSAAGEGWVAEWNFNSPDMGKLIAKVDSQIFSLCNISNENRLVAGNMNGGAHWVDLDNPDETKNILHHKKGIYGMLQIGDFLYSAGGDGMLTKWSVSENKTVESIHLSNQSLRGLDFSKKRQEIAVGASDNSIYLLDSMTLSLKKTIKNAHENSVFTVKYHP